MRKSHKLLSVYFSVSTYFIVTGLSGEEALVCRTCTFGDLYAGIGTIFGIAGIYLIAIGTLYLTPFSTAVFEVEPADRVGAESTAFAFSVAE